MSIDLKFVELTADVLAFFFINGFEFFTMVEVQHDHTIDHTLNPIDNRNPYRLENRNKIETQLLGCAARSIDHVIEAAPSGIRPHVGHRWSIPTG